METSQTKKLRKHHTKTGVLTTLDQAAVLFIKKYIRWVSATVRVRKSKKRRLTSLDLMVKVVRLGDRWQVNGIFTIPEHADVKMI